jgi:hypothetical protein
MILSNFLMKMRRIRLPFRQFRHKSTKSLPDKACGVRATAFGRKFSDSFAGIAPSCVMGFVLA